MATPQNDRLKKLAREGMPELPRRFYDSVSVSDGEDGAVIRLDGREMRTPAKRTFVVPTVALATAIAAEWEAQGERIDPSSMPLTRLANVVIDGVIDQPEALRPEIVAYAESDLVCYRAESPAGLVTEQADAWDPVVAWGNEAFGVQLAVAAGIMPVAQPPNLADRLSAELERLTPYQLAAIHVITAMTGSALLALGRKSGAFDSETVWHAAHVDEDWQIRQWGEDAEAAERRARRRIEFDAACLTIDLVRNC